MSCTHAAGVVWCRRASPCRLRVTHIQNSKRSCRTWQALQRHVVHDLVVPALQEAGVDGAEGSHALSGQAGGEAHCVLLSNAHIKDALGEALLKAVQACKMTNNTMQQLMLMVMKMTGDATRCHSCMIYAHDCPARTFDSSCLHSCCRCCPASIVDWSSRHNCCNRHVCRSPVPPAN